jgi:hypothetical protein
MTYESLNEALIDCVKAAGGSKQVGPLLWPEKAPDAAQRMLLDCLNDDRASKLSPEQVLLVLRMARAKGFHGGVNFMLADLGYAPTTPIEPRDEAAELQRQAVELLAAAERITERLQRLHPQLRMKAVA